MKNIESNFLNEAKKVLPILLVIVYTFWIISNNKFVFQWIQKVTLNNIILAQIK